MTTVKTILKSTLCICFCILLMCSLFSCKGNKGQDDLEALDTLQISGAALDGYQIIMSSEASGELVAAAKALTEKISTATGAVCEAVYDSDFSKLDGNIMPIFLGNTLHTPAECLSGMKKDDYSYKATDNYIFLGGRSDGATIAAISRFEDDVLPYCESVYIGDYEGNFTYRQEYSVSSLILCGFDFSEYEIVSPEQKNTAVSNIALKLRELVAAQCGAYPDIRFSSKPDNGKRELVFVVDGKLEGRARAYFDGEDFVLAAKDSYGLSVIAYEIGSELFSDISGGVATFNAVSEISFEYKTPTVKLMTCVLDTSNKANISTNILAMWNKIQEQAPDVVFFGEVENEAFDGIEFNLPDAYLLKFSATDDSHTMAIAYKTESFTCNNHEYGYTDGVAAAVTVLGFENGEEFAIAAFSANSAAAREKSQELMLSFFSDTQTPSFAVMIAKDGILPELSDKGIAAEQNAHLTAGSDKYTVGVFVSPDKVECSDKSSLSQDFGAIAEITVAESLYDDFERLD